MNVTEHIRPHLVLALSYVDSALTTCDGYFNRFMNEEMFLVFCVVYSVVFLMVSARLGKETPYRPTKGWLQRWTTDSKRGEASEQQKYQTLVMEEVWDEKRVSHLPSEGLKEKQLLDRIAQWEKKQGPINTKCLGAVYNSDREFFEGLVDYARIYMYQNPLHLDSFKELVVMESEVLRMTGRLLTQQQQPVFGVITSSTTESLIMLLPTYKQRFPSRIRSNIVVPSSAHFAFEKGCSIFNVELRQAKLDSSFRVCLKHMESLIDSNTLFICASYPSFAHGIIDPVHEIGKLALKYNVGFHIDASLGGFIAGFLKDHPRLLDVKGVSSVSMNPHKYGEAPKGIGANFFESESLRHCMYYAETKWMAGLYATMSLGGSRPGFASAGAWYSLTQVGRKNFIDSATNTVALTKRLATALKAIPSVEVFGDPALCCLAFTTTNKPWVFVASQLQKKGWTLSPVSLPDAIHVSVTQFNAKKLQEEFIKDLNQILKS